MNDIHTLSGAYAVDALDELERAAFERHLAECPECRTEVAGLQEAAALLASTTEVTPPPALRDAVLAGITQVRPLPPIVQRRPLVRRRWFPALVAAAVLAVVGVGTAVWQPWQDAEQTQQPTLSAAERVLQAPDAQSVSVDLGEAGRATVTRSVSLGRAVISTEEMAPAPSQKVYEIWLQNDEGAMVPAGLMPDEPSTTLLLEGDAASATAAGITVEPDGGSSEPTSEPIALFDFSQAT